MKQILIAIAVSLILGFTAQSRGETPSADTVEVVASGVGMDADKALRNALMNAVQQAVGLVVDAETLVKNEDVIKEQILTYSDGYVEHFDKIKDGKRDDGLYEVEIKATVKRRQLVEKLKASKVITSKVAGEAIFGEVITQLEAEKNASALLKNALEGLPLNLLSAQAVNQKPKIEQKAETGIKATWTIIISYNEKEYKEKVLPKLQKLLGDIARTKGSSTLVARPGPEAVYGTKFVTPTSKLPVWSADRSGVADQLSGISCDRKTEFLLLLDLDFNERNGQERLAWYVLDTGLEPIVTAISSRALAMRIALLDADDRALTEDSIPLGDFELTPPYEGSSHWSGRANLYGENFPRFAALDPAAGTYGSLPMNVLSISPLFKVAQAGRFSHQGRALEIDWTTDLSLEIMKQVAKIQCQLVDLGSK